LQERIDLSLFRGSISCLMKFLYIGVEKILARIRNMYALCFGWQHLGNHMAKEWVVWFMDALWKYCLWSWHANGTKWEILDNLNFDHFHGGGGFSHLYVIMHKYFVKKPYMQKNKNISFYIQFNMFPCMKISTHFANIWGHKF
jgi:hypothetical protein